MPVALLPVLAALLAGVGIAIQPPTNAILARASGSVLLAALISFGVGTAALLAAWVVSDRAPVGSMRGLPAYAWIGGFYGAFFVAAGAFAAPRIGVAAMATLVIVGQLVAALAIDRLGMFGVPKLPISPGRALGLALVVAGAIVVRRS